MEISKRRQKQKLESQRFTFKKSINSSNKINVVPGYSFDFERRNFRTNRPNTVCKPMRIKSETELLNPISRAHNNKFPSRFILKSNVLQKYKLLLRADKRNFAPIPICQLVFLTNNETPFIKLAETQKNKYHKINSSSDFNG